MGGTHTANKVQIGLQLLSSSSGKREEVHLPVAETLAVCLRRTVVYAHTVGNAPDSPNGTLPVLELVAAALVEFTSFGLVPANDLVYRLMGYADSLERHPD